MPGRPRYAMPLVVLLVPLLLAALVALAVLSLHAGTAHAAQPGGARLPGAPQVSAIRCLATPGAPCPVAGAVAPGGTLRILGRDLDAIEEVVFRGRKGAADDVTARPRHLLSGHLETIVPPEARSGPLALVSSLGATTQLRDPLTIEALPPRDLAPDGGYFLAGRRQPTFTVPASATTATVELVRDADGAVVRSWEGEPGSTIRWNGMLGRRAAVSGSYSFRLAAAAAGARPAASSGSDAFLFYDHIFPIRGKHDLGQSATNNFGGGRGHQGQDMFARCGVPLAAAQGGVVKRAGTDGRAGNYVVITGRGGNDYIYMHLNATPLVTTGQRVFTGQALGEVGDSGNASGCHLHFELWRSPGWYTGGRPFNALSLLRTWDALS